MSLEARLAGKRVVVVVGPGGVGKTTCSAALGLTCARRGERVALLTIDPARRLATALGVERLDDEPRAVNLAELGGASAGGRLDAMMLDPRSAFDRLVERYAADPDQMARILANKYYRTFSGAVGGAQEFIAMERLYELAQADRWDRLILDTPPTVHALDFLDAPQRLMRAVDESVFRWAAAPSKFAGRAGARVVSFGSAYILKVLAGFIGGQMIQDLTDYLHSFAGMFDGFRARAEAVEALLAAPETGFVLVAGPRPSSLFEARRFLREIERMNLPLAGVAINRVRPALGQTPDADELSERLRRLGLDAADADALAAPLAACAADWAIPARSREQILSAFVQDAGGDDDVRRVELLDHDVADLPALLALARRLVPAWAPPTNASIAP